MQNPSSNGQEQMSNLTFAGQSGLLTSSTINENDRRIQGANRSGASHSTASVAGIKRCAEEDAGLKWECEDSSEDDEPKKLPPPNGKKTKGRVKIKMEFIDNKLRRYTTFSKRKTGIMKKAYELSTLTGTQVMLLVASETGHVYTFATRKLQPMITSEAGKALIQTCLNSPDPPLTNGGHPHMHIDQRMSATGFEETDLSYAVNEDDNSKQDNKQGVFTVTGVTGSLTPNDATQASNSTPSTQPTPATSTVSIATLLNSTVNSSTGTSKNPNLSMQLPTSGFATLLTPAGLTATPIHFGSLQTPSPTANSQVPPKFNVVSPMGITSTTAAQQKQPLLRVSQPLVSIPGLAPNTATNNQSGGNSESTQGHSTVTMVPNSQGNVATAMVSGNMVLPSPAIVTSSNSTLTGTVMYQTAQGVVYAPTGALPEGLIFNIQQSPTSLSLGQEQGNTHQQYITIPVSLASANQLMQPVFTQANTNTTQTSITATDLSTSGNNHLSCSSKTRK